MITMCLHSKRTLLYSVATQPNPTLKSIFTPNIKIYISSHSNVAVLSIITFSIFGALTNIDLESRLLAYTFENLISSRISISDKTMS